MANKKTDGQTSWQIGGEKIKEGGGRERREREGKGKEWRVDIEVGCNWSEWKGRGRLRWKGREKCVIA